MIDYTAKPKYKGYTIEIDLPKERYDGYSAECTYKFNKKEQKYALSMWLKRNDLDEKFTAQGPNHQLSWWNGEAPLGQDLCVSA